MLGKMKQLYDLQKQAREMQNKMKEISVSGFSKNEDVEVVMDGTQKVKEIGIKDELMSVDRKKDLIKSLKQALDDANGKLQKEMMKNVDINQLKGMLG